MEPELLRGIPLGCFRDHVFQFSYFRDLFFSFLFFSVPFHRAVGLSEPEAYRPEVAPLREIKVLFFRVFVIVFLLFVFS